DFSSGGLISGFGGSALLGRGGGGLGITALAPLIQFITGPATISMPVKDQKVVGEFLAELDNLMNTLRSSPDFAQVRQVVEYYKGPSAGQPVRVLAGSFGGLKARLYLARIGDGLYLTNRPTLIDDLAAPHAEGRRSKPASGHALVRVRPENWREVLPTHN